MSLSHDINISEGSVPWDDPIWDDPDVNESPNKDMETNNINEKSTQDQYNFNNKNQNVHPGEHGDKDDQEQFIREFKQFNVTNTMKAKPNYHADKKYQNEGNVGGFVRNNDDRRRGPSKSNNNRSNDRRYDFRQPTKMNSSNKYYNGLNLKIEVKREESEQEQKHNEARHVYMNADKHVDGPRNDHFDDMKKSETTNCEDLPEQNVPVVELKTGNNNKSYINGNRKPAIQIYNSAAVRGKWSNLSIDNFQDAREDKLNRRQQNNRHPQQQYHQQQHQKYSPAQRQGGEFIANNSNYVYDRPTTNDTSTSTRLSNREGIYDKNMGRNQSLNGKNYYPQMTTRDSNRQYYDGGQEHGQYNASSFH